MNQFAHLHVHSAYSLRESLVRIDQLVEDALAYEMPAVALTDVNAMYGAISFYQTAKKRGVQPILGVQLTVSLADDHAKPPTTREAWTHVLDTVVVLARNERGYSSLTRLVTAARARGYQPFVTLAELASSTTDLICLIGGGESLLLRQFAGADKEQAAVSLMRLANACPTGQVYIDVQDHQLPSERLGLPGLLEASQAIDLPLVATNDVRYRTPLDASLHRAYATLEHADAATRWPNDQFSFVPTVEMKRRFANLPNAIENTLLVAEQCQMDLQLHQVRMPTYPTKDNRPADTVLREAATAGARQRYGAFDDVVATRLAYELDVICSMGYADYFLVVADFIRYAHQQGISTGPGRGSAASSLVAYALRITDVDPVANRLLFERFLNPERVSLPDIDTDFEFERRGEVIQYVVEKYGRDRVAQIGTFGTLAARAAVRDAGRLLQADTKLVDRMAKMIPGTPGMTLAAAREEVRGFADFLASDSDAMRLYETAGALEGLPHHTSIHAAGVVIAPDRLADWVPLEMANEGTSVTQYAMADVEALGLVKMDFLGLRTLTLIDDCVKSVRHRLTDEIDWRAIQSDDKATYDMLTQAETNGVFQMESPGIRRVLRQFKPSNLDDIVAVISLYRPGPMENIPAFCDAKHGRRPIHYPHPDLSPILEDTYGVIVYQEQIMQIASRMAGFTLAQADLLRRAVSKKKREVLDDERTRFVTGCVTKGYDETTANEVYDLIVRFADYGFPRSHAAAYGVLSFRTAYLRAHYLADFLAALMTMALASPEKIQAYTEDAKRHQIPVRSPSVLSSVRGYSVDENGAIRTGLLAIRNVGEGAVENILAARADGSFASLRDFLQRVNERIVNRRAVDSLLAAGALDELFPGDAANHAKLQMLEEAFHAVEEARQFEGLGLNLTSTRAVATDRALGTKEPTAADTVLYVRYTSAGGRGKETLKAVQVALAASAGDIPVALYDEATRRTRLLGDKWRVDISPELVTMLEDIVGIGNVKVRS